MDKKKKKDKRFYQMQAKREKQGKYQMVPDLRGFLLSSNRYEKEWVRDAYNILNEAADLVYGPEKPNDEGAKIEAEDDDEEEDIEAALKKEKEEIVANSAKDIKERRFQQVQSNVQNIMFIRTTVPEPAALTDHIFDSALKTGVQKTKRLLRIIPVERTCKAKTECVSEALQEILPKWFKDKENVSYSVMFKKRMNNNFEKSDAIDLVNAILRKSNPSMKVDYKDPEFVIMFEVMKGYCCISILANYFKFKKYNILESSIVAKNSNDENDLPESVVKQSSMLETEQKFEPENTSE